MFENSSEIILIVGPDGTLRYASPAFDRILSYDSEEAIGTMNVLDYVHPDDLPHVLEETEKALSEGGIATNNAEYRFLHKDGSWRWMESMGTYLLDDPMVGGVVVTSRDITERKEAERRLREAEERYRTLVETVPAVTYTDRAVGSYPDLAIYTSPQIEELLGYSLQEWLDPERVLWEERLHPEDRTWVLTAEERSRASGEPFSEEYRLLAKDGSVVWVRDEAVLLRNEAGEPLYWQGVLVDVTDRKEAEEARKASEGRFRQLFERSTDALFVYDERGRFVDCNAEACRALGYERDELLALSVADVATHLLFEEERRKRKDDTLWKQATRSEPGKIVGFEENELRRKDGTTLPVEVGVGSIEYEGRRMIFASVRDLTERKRAEETLKESEQRFRGSFERAATGMALVGTDGRFLRVNRSLCEILGYPERELLGKTFQEITHPYDLDADLDQVRRMLVGEIRTYQMEKRYFHKEGHVVWALLSVSMVHDEEDEPLYFVSQIQDISERKVLEERLAHRAFHDTLTDLPNRHLLVNRLAHALDRTQRRGDWQAVVLFMDLDGFKVVNDSLGHDAGDHLLVLLAERLRRCVRPEDTLARFGGDEFVVLLEDVEDPSEAVRVAERITNELKRPFEMYGRSLFASFSIGIAQGNARTKSPLDLLRDADTAMYRAKSEHDDYRVFDPAMYERAMKRLELENDLRRGVENQEFVVHYQPVVDLETGETWGMEALLRWEHPERGLLEASEFMAILEESGLAVPAGERVLEEACVQALRWQEQRPLTPPLVVSVNLSAVQLERPNLARIGAEVLGKTGLDPRRLSLDVTETAYIRILEERIATLDRLKELGVGVAIDDFGVGYSSLSYLKRLPADILKIDRSFVRGVGEVEEDTSIVRMVIDLAHTLGMKVVAEGIEEWEQAALLAEMGCDLGQGFYFSRPLSPEAVPEFLAG